MEAIQVEEDVIQYDYLPKHMYDLVAPVFERYGVEMPDPELSRIAYAMKGIQLVGFYILQAIQHAEPMWIHPDYRGTKVAIKLAAMIDNIRGKGKVYVVAENEESDKMCLALGLKKVEYPIYVKED